MAFVSVSQRKITQIGENGSFPSPAHYSLQKKPISQDAAPFHSTSIRSITFSQEAKNVTPGPGQYNVGKQLGQPNVSSYLCLNNVIFKVNSLGSASFQSESKRFNQSIEISPGPTQYQNTQESISLKKSRSKFPKQKQANQFAIIPSIPEKARGLLSLMHREKTKIEEKPPGPGSYESLPHEHINSRGAVWAKDKVKRFKKEKEVDIGPGKYLQLSTERQKDHQQSSVFKSNTVRTFFDSLMYGSQMQNVTKIRELKHYKDPSPSPGSYNYETSSFKTINSKPLEYQFFGSPIQRFQGKEGKKDPDIQFYDVNEAVNSKISHNKRHLPFNSKTKRDDSFLSVKNNEEMPGPGYYLRQSEPKRGKNGKVIQCFGSTSHRTLEPLQANEVGPGHYNVTSTDTPSETPLQSRFGQVNQQNGVFKSRTSRKAFQSKSSIEVGEYDVSYNDIASKIDRQKYYLQTLRRINVVKPPFESNSQRFQHYYQSIEKADNPEIQPPPPPFRKQRRFEMPKIIPGASFGKNKRFFSKRKGGGSPGAGAYESPDQWNKITFNRRFQYE